MAQPGLVDIRALHWAWRRAAPIAPPVVPSVTAETFNILHTTDTLDAAHVTDTLDALHETQTLDIAAD
jgi:hypothetical protein